MADSGGMTDAGGMTDTGGTDAAMTDAGSDAPDPTLICDSGLAAFSEVCAACLSDSCCPEARACVGDSMCAECIMMGGMPGCSVTLDALSACTMGSCATPCAV
jgi:hypothetical protein